MNLCLGLFQSAFGIKRNCFLLFFLTRNMSVHTYKSQFGNNSPKLNWGPIPWYPHMLQSTMDVWTGWLALKFTHAIALSSSMGVRVCLNAYTVRFRNACLFVYGSAQFTETPASGSAILLLLYSSFSLLSANAFDLMWQDAFRGCIQWVRAFQTFKHDKLNYREIIFLRNSIAFFFFFKFSKHWGALNPSAWWQSQQCRKLTRTIYMISWVLQSHVSVYVQIYFPGHKWQ